MKKSFVLFGIATALLASNAEAADIKPYVSAKLSYSLMKNKISAEDSFDILEINHKDNVFGGSLAGGISVPVAVGAIRTEAELHLNADTNKNVYYGLINTKVKSRAAFVNAYYDIATGTRLTPLSVRVQVWLK